ncbi:hypothetical protein, partial [Neisseria cinerea]|uniref:hypothetical protein n=1 Tax=Neisseria cinerea TaxID=483 RepID=UPI002B1D2098
GLYLMLMRAGLDMPSENRLMCTGETLWRQMCDNTRRIAACGNTRAVCTHNRMPAWRGSFTEEG